jgi:hypothetical protein
VKIIDIYENTDEVHPFLLTLCIVAHQRSKHMTVTPSSPTVGIFKDRSMAEQAIDALHTAGFTSEQVRYSAAGTSGSILADLKSLFTGQNTNSGNITNDLTDMGLSNEEAQYYSHEFTNGNTILAVLASGREQEALNILHQYGAYNTRTSNSSSTTTYSQQPSDFAKQAAVTSDDASLQQQQTYQETQQGPSNAGDRLLPDGVTSYSDTTSQDNLPDDVSTTQQPEYQPTHPLAPDYHSTPQVTLSPDLATPATTSDDSATHLEQTTPSDTGTSDPTPELQNTQPDTAPSNSASVATPSDTGASDPEVSDSTPELQNTSPATATSESADEFQQLQEQLQAAQQQLQDAKTQLQAAKEHEAQIQTIREREQKLQAARQQLQDIQAQLQATLAELHETQGRLPQY